MTEADARELLENLRAGHEDLFDTDGVDLLIHVAVKMGEVTTVAQGIPLKVTEADGRFKVEIG